MFANPRNCPTFSHLPCRDDETQRKILLPGWQLVDLEFFDTLSAENKKVLLFVFTINLAILWTDFNNSHTLWFRYGLHKKLVSDTIFTLFPTLNGEHCCYQYEAFSQIKIHQNALRESAPRTPLGELPQTLSRLGRETPPVPIPSTSLNLLILKVFGASTLGHSTVQSRRLCMRFYGSAQ